MIPSSSNPKTRRIILAVVAVLLLLGLSALAWLNSEQGKKMVNNQVACTADAKLCPDGSSVGRQGPNCEFATCPIPSRVTTDQPPLEPFDYNKAVPEVYKQDGAVWPPNVSSESGEFLCNEKAASSDSPEIVVKKTIGDREYCVSVFNEGTAGAVYTSYVYKTKVGEQIAVIKFTLRYPDCNNYSDAKKEECQTERKNFHVDVVPSTIVVGLSS